MKRLILFFVMSLLVMNRVAAQNEIDDFLTYGESRMGIVTNDQPTFTLGFEGVAGDLIYIAALEESVPVEFTLFSPGGGQLAQSDDALIKNLELGTDGLYTIEFARPEQSDEDGTFIAFLGLYEIKSLNVENEGWTLYYEGNLADTGALQQFEVDFEEGELVSMDLYAANSQIMVQSSTGEYILFEGTFDDPQIPLYRFPATDTYTLTVQTVEPGGSDFAFVVFRYEPIAITANEVLSGKLEESFPSTFTFETPAGKMWDINATLPLNGDRLLALYQFDGREYWEAQLITDEGSGPNGQPRIQPFIPDEDGTYLIALWYDDWDTEGELYDYELSVSPSTLLSIPNKSPISGEINNETGATLYAYQGNAGQIIRVTFRRLSGDGDLALSIYSEEDEVATFMGRNATQSSFELELPLDGFYQFVIRNASYDEQSVLTYEVLVEPLLDK